MKLLPQGKRARLRTGVLIVTLVGMFLQFHVYGLGHLLTQSPHEAFIREMENGALPLDRPMITPVGLTRSPLLEKIH